MLTAEMQRIVLLVALAATAYMLVLAWNDDYIKAPPGSGNSTTLSAEPILEGAATVTPSDTSHSDIPAVETGTESAAVTAHPAATVVGASDRLVRVTTGAMDVWIDRLGGDIVRVQLPRYPVSIDDPDQPFLLLDRRADLVYIAQSGLIGRDGPDASAQRPLYDADHHALKLSGGGELALTLQRGAVRIRKVYTFSADEYLIDLKYAVENRGDAPFEANLFAQIKRDATQPGGGSYALGPRPYLGAALTTDDERYQKLTFSDLEKAPFREVVHGGWIAMLQHYFISAWVGDPDAQNRYFGQQQKSGDFIVGYTSPAQTIAPGGSGTFSSRFYAGPKDQGRLEAISPNLNLTVDYGFLWWLSGPLFHLLEWLHALVGNWGVAIILLTCIVKLVLFPLSAASYRSMANMRRVAPQMKRMQERYADDRQKLSQEMMGFYKKEKINPLGGCLPMLLQMPVFLALYWVLFESVELRQAPFFLWIRDLAIMDPYFVLPILMGASMFLTQTLNPPVPDPVQARVMKFMPVIFTVMFLFFPAGLVLYWLVNNLLSLAQQWFITRQIEGGAKAANS